MNLVRQRRVLDQLHEVILIHHLARRDGKVAPDLECRRVGHLHTQLPAAAALEVLEQVVQPLDQVLAA